MICLKSLTISNIGRFTNSQTITFSNSSLIQVDGKNHNTSGSSGSGKSTIFESLMYLLGISDRTATQLQSRLSKNKMLVTGEFNKNNHHIKITRGTGTLQLSINGQEFKGLTKIIEEKIDELLGIPRYILKKIIYKKQKEGGFFLQMTPKESYQFTMDVLGLTRWTEKLEKLADKESIVGKEISALELKLEHSERLLSEYVELIKGKIKPQKPDNLDINNIQQLKNQQYQSKQQEINRVPIPTQEEVNVHVYHVEMKKLSRDIAEYEDKITCKQQSIKKEIEKYRILFEQSKDSARNLKEAQNRKPQIENAIKELNMELQYMQHDQCPTCKQEWDRLGSQNKILEHNKQINRLRTDLKDINTITSQEVNIINNLRDAKKKYDDSQLKQVNPELIDNLDRLVKRKAKVEANIEGATIKAQNKYLMEKQSYMDEISKINEKYQPLIEHYERLELTLKNYEQAIDIYEQEMNVLKEKAKHEFNNNTQLKQQAQDLIKEAELITDSKKLIKEYTLQIFSDMLEQVSSLANEKLSKIPNMQQASIHFEVNKETKSGKIRQEINPVINLGEELNIPLKTLSGGERTAIDLCVDLSVIDVIEQYTNSGMDFYVLDEPFTGLDEVSKIEFLHALENIDSNKRMIIVDHSPELKSIINDIILVERDGTTSQITQ